MLTISSFRFKTSFLIMLWIYYTAASFYDIFINNFYLKLQKTYETAARRIGELVRQLEDQEKIYQSIEERYITEFKSNLEVKLNNI